MNFSIECEEEVDGRWIAEVPQLPGVLCYGKTADDAMAKAEVLALRAMADRLEHNQFPRCGRTWRSTSLPSVAAR